MMHRQIDLDAAVDICPGFSEKELKEVGSKTMQNKLSKWLAAREPAQFTFQRQNEADIRQCQARRKG